MHFAEANPRVVHYFPIHAHPIVDYPLHMQVLEVFQIILAILQ